jgi:NAD(P)-dependent dehydrogenase (short-subunit alcohol dehydrogenase family)
MAGRLEGKVVIVTGGATGIGEAASWLFASEGAAVIVADTKAKEDKGKTMVDEIQFQGGTANFVRRILFALILANPVKLRQWC